LKNTFLYKNNKIKKPKIEKISKFHSLILKKANFKSRHESPSGRDRNKRLKHHEK
jgi:hypothetical protein